MKKYFVFAQLCIVLIMFSCGNKTQEQLTGKWQKTGNPEVIIEFKSNGVYEISIEGIKLTSLKYSYSPGTSENNLQIGEGQDALKGDLEFIQKDKIRIKTNDSGMNAEYQKIS